MVEIYQILKAVSLPTTKFFAVDNSRAAVEEPFGGHGGEKLAENFEMALFRRANPRKTPAHSSQRRSCNRTQGILPTPERTRNQRATV